MAINTLDGDVYNLLPKLRMYILLRLDSALSGGGATYEYNLITVEHVLPQNPERSALSLLPSRDACLPWQLRE